LFTNWPFIFVCVYVCLYCNSHNFIGWSCHIGCFFTESLAFAGTNNMSVELHPLYQDYQVAFISYIYYLNFANWNAKKNCFANLTFLNRSFYVLSFNVLQGFWSFAKWCGNFWMKVCDVCIVVYAYVRWKGLIHV
jgi:hypothetical protein